MFSCNDSNQFLRRLFGGLMIAVTLVIGSLTQAVSGVQAFI